jgi:hypothetical protein
MPINFPVVSERFVRDIRFDHVESRITTVERYYYDKAERWQNRKIEIAAADFMAIVDTEHAAGGLYSYRDCDNKPSLKEIGWYVASGEIPDVAPPNDGRRYEPGLRVRMLVLAHGDSKFTGLREWLTTAKYGTKPLVELSRLIEEQRPQDGAHLVAVVGIERWQEQPTDNGIVYEPIFKISRWTARPRELPKLPPPAIPTPEERERMKAEKEARNNGSPAPHVADSPPVEAYGGDLERQMDKELLV